MNAPSAPPTPDPYKVANAQSVANVEVAVAQTALSNADEVRPEASVSFETFGPDITTYTYDPTTGAQVASRTFKRWKKTTTLSDAAQTAFEQQQNITIGFNTWALAQIGILTATQGTPLSTSGLTARLSIPTTPTMETGEVTASPLTMNIGVTDIVDHLHEVRDTLNSRIQWQIDIDRAARITELANMGIVPGMKAYDDDIFAFDKQSTDARLMALIEAGKEQSRIVLMEEHKAQFANGAVKDKFELDNQTLERANQRKEHQYRVLRDACEYVEVLRQHQLQEAMSVRSTNINEISTLVHGGSVQVPQFQAFSPGHISDTPVAQSVYQSAAMDMNKWQMRVERQNQIMSGIMGMAGNIIGGGLAGGQIKLPM